MKKSRHAQGGKGCGHLKPGTQTARGVAARNGGFVKPGNGKPATAVGALR